MSFLNYVRNNFWELTTWSLLLGGTGALAHVNMKISGENREAAFNSSLKCQKLKEDAELEVLKGQHLFQRTDMMMKRIERIERRDRDLAKLTMATASCNIDKNKRACAEAEELMRSFLKTLLDDSATVAE